MNDNAPYMIIYLIVISKVNDLYVLQLFSHRVNSNIKKNLSPSCQSPTCDIYNNEK